MKTSLTRNKLLDEIAKIPEDKLPYIYNFIHSFRLELQKEESKPQSILNLAGSWSDMPEEDFNELLNDVKARRKSAFFLRRNRETSVD